MINLCCFKSLFVLICHSSDRELIHPPICLPTVPALGPLQPSYQLLYPAWAPRCTGSAPVGKSSLTGEPSGLDTPLLPPSPSQLCPTRLLSAGTGTPPMTGSSSPLKTAQPTSSSQDRAACSCLRAKAEEVSGAETQPNMAMEGRGSILRLWFS